MTRREVFGMRLAASAVVLALVAAVARLFWYPGGYGALAGVERLLLILVAISFVIGPGLTALIYRPGKRGLRFDIVVLAALELAAIAWASHEIYDRRPAYTVFAVDRFEVVTAGEVDRAAARAAGIADRPGHAPRLVFAQMPADPAVRSQLINDVVLGGMPDIDRRPEFWRPYPAGIAQVLHRARPLARLRDAGLERARLVERWLECASAAPGDYVFLPIRGKRGDAAIVLHARVGFPVTIIDVDPWIDGS